MSKGVLTVMGLSTSAFSCAVIGGDGVGAGAAGATWARSPALAEVAMQSRLVSERTDERRRRRGRMQWVMG